MKIGEIRELTQKEISLRVKEVQNELLKMRINNSVNGVEHPAKIRIAKVTIARLKTVLKEHVAKQSEKN